MKISRIKDIEGSFLDSVSGDLEECMVEKNIHYIVSFRYKKGKIIRAYFKDNTLDLYVSAGHFVEGLLLCVTVFVIISILLSVVG